MNEQTTNKKPLTRRGGEMVYMKKELPVFMVGEFGPEKILLPTRTKRLFKNIFNSFFKLRIFYMLQNTLEHPWFIRLPKSKIF